MMLMKVVMVLMMKVMVMMMMVLMMVIVLMMMMSAGGGRYLCDHQAIFVLLTSSFVSSFLCECFLAPSSRPLTKQSHGGS